MGCASTKEHGMAVSSDDKHEEHHHHGGEKPAGLLLSQAASEAKLRVPFARQPHIRLVDDKGATVHVDGYVVNVTLMGRGGVLLPAGKCQGVSKKGVVEFSGLYVDGHPSNEYMLFFSCADVGTTSQGLVVLPNEVDLKPTGVAILTPATSPSYVGVPFAQQPRVRLTNSSGGTVPVSGYQVVASVAPAPGQVGQLLPAANCVGVSILFLCISRACMWRVIWGRTHSISIVRMWAMRINRWILLVPESSKTTV